MTYCLNPDCPKPRNSDSARTCRSCGATLMLKGRYCAIAALGQGGFGRTFLAIDEDKPSKPQCVIKQFLPVTQNPRSLKKAAALFQQEAVRLEELGHHPQIPELLAYFNQEGNQYLVQEFIHGKNLADVLAEQGAFTENQVRDVFAKLLPVLDFIHSHSVIHRDIKPGNIIITVNYSLGMGLPRPGQVDWSVLQQALAIESSQGFRNFVSPSYRFHELLGITLSQPPRELPVSLGRRCQQLAMQFSRYPALSLGQRQYLVADANRLVYELQQASEMKPHALSIGRLVLVDFGAAKSIKRLEPMQTGTTIGSPEFAAPEQARGKAVFSSDLYSLGVTGIHLLTNVSPYDLFDSATNTWIWRKFLLNPVSEPMGYILDRLLETAIAHRYQTAAEVLHDLEGTSISPVLQATPTPLASQMSVQLSFKAPGSPILTPTPPRSTQPSFRIARRVHTTSSRMVAPLQTEPAPTEVKPKRKTQPTWECVHTFENAARVYAIALSPTEPILASSSGKTIRLWDLNTLQPIRTLTGHLDIIPALAMSTDGKYVMSGSADKTIIFWDVQTGKRLSSLTLHSDTVLALAVSSDAQMLASSSFYDPIMVWSLTTAQKQHGLLGHSSRVDALVFNPDNTLLASGSGDLTVKVWNVETGEAVRVFEGHTHQISDVAFSPNGNILASSSWDGTVKLWNLKTRRHRTLEIAAGRVNGVAFSSDGKKLAIASDTLQVWNLPSGKQTILERGHSDSVSTVLFGSDDQTLISASVDRTIKIWRWE